MLGFDPRLQFLHEHDLLGVLQHAVADDVPGTFNVAGDGVLMLSQAVRRLQRARGPAAGFAVGGLGSVLRSARLADFSPEQLGFLTYGRGSTPPGCATELGFEPALHHRRGVRRLRPLAAPTGGYAERLSTAPRGSVDPATDPSSRRPAVGDAEIIPIGTRGRPGRGTGNARPSAAARNLAGRAPPEPTAAPRPASARRARRGEAAPPARSRRRRSAAARSRAPEPPPVAPPTTRERAPLAGIPAGDWLGAFQPAASELFGEQWEPQLARFLAFLRRRVTGDYVVDEYGFDPEITERFLMAALRPIAEKWFRIEVRGAENIPAEGGALVVSNHSGTIPVDGLMTMVSIHDHTGRYLRPLGADLVFRMPVVSALARKGGATLACNEDAERMLAGGELVGVWPEGFKGIGKPYAERYKLQRFGRGGFVSAALRTGVPIVPLSVVGAEEIYPLVGNVPVAGPAARRALHPDHAVLPAARPARPGAAAVEVAAGVRRADPHRRVRRRARPTTRCWSSTSPTRCARRSSRRSTPC